MTSALVSIASLVTLFAGHGLPATPSTADLPRSRVTATIDVPAPELWASDGVARRGGQAARIEFDDTRIDSGTAAWYRLAYVDGGSRLQVFEHSARTTTGPHSDAMESEATAWDLANEALRSRSAGRSGAPLPPSARIRTGNQTGFSAGLIFTLAYIDLLTAGALVGNLRVSATGGVTADGVVTPVLGVDVKVAAALLTRPDVIFAPSSPQSISPVTFIESHHTRLIDSGYTISDWLALDQFRQAGETAARHHGTVAVVVVHDVRQVLAWLCGRTHDTTVCTASATMATVPIGTA